MNNQHILVPKMDLKAEGLTHNDPFVYACIKRYMNSSTHTAFPSMSLLERDSGLSRKTLMAAIDRLEAAGYIKIDKTFGKSNKYIFNDYKKFEIFSYDFLDSKELSPKDKAYLVASQQFMWKNTETQTGLVRYNSEQFADSIGLSLSSLHRREDKLMKQGILSLKETESKELAQASNGEWFPSSGLNKYYREYSFDAFCNVLAMKFNEQDERLDNCEQGLTEVTTSVFDLQQELQRVKKELNELKGIKEIIL